ncbi:MAG: SLC13 family permease [Methylophilaceae bacterium]
MLPADAGILPSIVMLTSLAALLSGFMNNVGALALLMPVALQLASRLELPPGRMLMPLAFGSILGGMTTLVGTPPNLIVSSFRASAGNNSFSMFDFSPVGLPVAALGVLFIALLGWRWVPVRQRAGTEGFETGAYLTEVLVAEGSKAAGMCMREIEAALDEAEAQVLALVRNNVRLNAPRHDMRVLPGDILVIEAEAETLSQALSPLGLKLEESKKPAPADDEESGEKEGQAASASDPDAEAKEKPAVSDEIVLMEFAVLPGADLIGRSATDLLRTAHGINLLAVSRQDNRSLGRLRTLPFRAGDVLLMQGPAEALTDLAGQTGCIPLAQRALRIPNRLNAILASLIMAAAVCGAAFGLLPAAISFAAGVLASMALRTVSPRDVYAAVDWPVVVLLAALIPVAGTLESTGAGALVARTLIENVAQGSPVFALLVIMVVTMTLSDLMNNAATAAVMCPIALGTAAQLGVNPDAYLMAVTVGASCAFLTPIGHQNNTLILGPGGFRFGDYWRLGLPLEILVVAAGMPALLWAWPL